MKNRKFVKLLVLETTLMLGVFVFLVAVNILPTKIAVEDTTPVSTLFYNTFEHQLYKSDFVTDYPNMNRIDILFKNPNLESRDVVQVNVSDKNGQIISTKQFSGYNLGDTTQARMDLDKHVVQKGSEFSVELVTTKIVDGKLSFGTKNDKVEIIKYYKSGLSVSNALDRSIEILKNILKYQPIVLLLPMILLGIWLW